MAGQGGVEGQQDRAIGRRSQDNIVGSLAGTRVVNPTELHWFHYGNLLELVPCLFLEGMALLLRKSSAQARIEGWDPRNRSDDDYAVVDDIIVGRIYREIDHRETEVVVVLATDPGGMSGEVDSAAKSGNGRLPRGGAGSVQKAL